MSFSFNVTIPPSSYPKRKFPDLMRLTTGTSTNRKHAFSLDQKLRKIEQAQQNAVPKKTQSDTKYCIGMWNEWRLHRQMKYQDNIPEITDASWAQLEFTDFRGDLDAERKRLQQQGLGSRKQQAEPLTLEEEVTLWEKGLLGVTIHKLF